MSEPEFYRMHRSGIRFEFAGTLLELGGVYHRYYGLGGVHTWDDWGLYCTDVSIDAPETEIVTVSIPGRNGALDFSEVLAGEPVYHNRTLTFSFCWLGRMERWHDLYSAILAELHGKICNVTLDTQPGWHYIGRCSVSSLRQDGVYSTFCVSMNAEPFRRRNWVTTSPALWDPFNFETDTTRDETYYSGIAISPQTTKEIVLYNCRRIFQPTVSVVCSKIKEDSGRWDFTIQNSENKFSSEDFPANSAMRISLLSLRNISYTGGTVTLRITNNAPVIPGDAEANVLIVSVQYLEGVL